MDMPNRPVRELIQGQQVLSAPASITVAEAARRMKAAKVGALMVVVDDDLVGLFTERDALYRVLAAGLDPAKTTIAAVMSSNLRTISPDRPFAHALHLMYDGGFRHVPVVENGKPVGMVSARDALGPEMEQFKAELDTRERIGEILG
jgi:CBS domain-containing protein